MYKFEKGEKVKIVGMKDHQELNGKEVTILSFRDVIPSVNCSSGKAYYIHEDIHPDIDYIYEERLEKIDKEVKIDFSTIENLEPCPFCGNPAIIVRHPGINWDGKKEHVNIGAMHGTWYVGCPHPFFDGSVAHCEIAPSASWFADLQEVINVWNSRSNINRDQCPNCGELIFTDINKSDKNDIYCEECSWYKLFED